ncbi:hypothetical protein NQ315_012014 [Exocentrus adspersus]|uniref:Histidine-rich glycoprotein-like n=1 Tax=Exocentrus adspersus TaxID=1586481 RepID=A0AAV8W268_9CUCU|nr:hypothetical protein NQ315_012014 [Exocentrus adspersus]
MGAWVLASMLVYSLLAQVEISVGATIQRNNPIWSPSGQTQGKGFSVGGTVHSAVPALDNPEASATNYQQYNTRFSNEDVNNNVPYHLYKHPYGEPDQDPVYKEFSSVEAEAQGYNQNEFLDTTGYNHYKTATSFNLEGPRQLETITTQSFHKEVEPYDVSDFEKARDHKEDDHGEVHYHKHKHLHKHEHKQEHTHKHLQEHKHDHDHKHDHKAEHEHKHEAKHKHLHHSEHKHEHKGEHHHKHHQEHKHHHHADHKHEHKHHQEHDHHHHHKHKHDHEAKHKHEHHGEHKHEHKHGHKHENEHKHKHEHHQEHKHKHEHKGEHKHKHRSHHQHKHSGHKHG